MDKNGTVKVFMNLTVDKKDTKSICLPGDIIFNAGDPTLPPDFIFGEDAEFLPEPSELPVSTVAQS